MKSAKQEMLELLQQMPESASMEAILSELFLKQKLKNNPEQLAQGKVIGHLEVKERMVTYGEQKRLEDNREDTMSNVKDQMVDVIRTQPDDATYEEIMRELAFERMVEQGLADSRQGRVVSNEEMGRTIRTWGK
jgi:predicted transcriptional regulator